MRKYFPKFLAEAFYFSDDELRSRAKGNFYSQRKENLERTLEFWLRKYHSDYRW